jgi:hypothetical protein
VGLYVRKRRQAKPDELLLQTGDIETAQAKIMHKIHRALATGGMHGIDLVRVSQFQQQDMFDNGRKTVID